MPPDPPPPTTPRRNSNILFTPDNSQPTTFNVVTQPSQLTQDFDSVSTPVRQAESDQQYYTETWLLDHANSNVTPIVEPSNVPHYPTPTTDSPDTTRATVRDAMEATTIERSEVASAARSILSLSSQSSQARYSPSTSMLMFLRNEDIDNEIESLKASGKSTFSTNNVLRFAKRSWSNTRKVKVEDKKFGPYRKTLDSSNFLPALGRTHNRMLLEDIMSVVSSPSKQYVLLVHQSNKLVCGQDETWWSRRIKSMLSSHINDVLSYVQFQSNLYWAIKVKIRSNPQETSLNSKTYTEKDITYGCTKRGGWGLTVEVPSGECTNLLFCDLIQCPEQIQLWADGVTTNYTRIKEKLRRLTNNISLTAAVKRLLKEAYGDEVLTQDICHKYTDLLNNRSSDIKESIVRTSTISSTKIKNHYSLPAGNKEFIAFRDQCNSECKEAVDSTYGTFNVITDPLLSHSQVSNININTCLSHIYNLTEQLYT